MARRICTYGGMDLNDGTTWFLLSADPGERVKTYDEEPGYDGTVQQFNVSEAHLVQGDFRFKVEDVSPDAIQDEVDALNALIDAGEQDLVLGSVTYSCVHSQRVKWAPEHDDQTVAFIDFFPVRQPEESGS